MESQAALPKDEVERLQTLKSYRVLDTLPEREFDDLTRLASFICQTPVALISLLDETRQWFKSRHGIDAVSTPRELAFCAHAILEDQVMVVEDSLQDARFRKNPLATDAPNVRFYAGAPLITPQGHRIGTICVIDHVPRHLSADQLEALAALSRQVVSQLELRLKLLRGEAHELELTRARNEAVEATKIKGEFLANMSHEIRTPMSGIIGMTEIMMDSPLESEQKNRLQVIQNCSTSLLSLLNDILDFSKLESGRIEFEVIPFNLRQTVLETLEIFQSTAQQKNLSLRAQFSAGLAEQIYGDPHRIRQILNNLIGNALKFTNAGEVRIEVSSQTVAPNQIELKIGVHDSGEGIPLESQQKLFRSFAQADASTTRKFGGTGLGLAICKGLCEKMGGEIWLESKVGQGSSFLFSLPAQVLPLEAATVAPTILIPTSCSSNHFGSLKVLLAEDNPINQIVMKGLLAKLGCEPDIAQNGREAIRKASEKDYDLILMDCHMPEVDGFDACSEILARAAAKLSSKPVRVVALTASSSDEDRRRCLETGMVGFLTKPVNFKDLEKTLSMTQPHDLNEALAAQEPVDQKALKTRFEGLEGVFPMAVEGFKKDVALRLQDIAQGLTNRDARAVQLAAHSIKGMVGEFEAALTRHLSEQLEQRAKTGQLEGCQTIFDTLSLELRRLELFLEKVDPDLFFQS